MPKDFNNNNESSRSRARDDAINSYLGFFNERTSETGSDEETESGEEMEVDQQQQHALDWEAEEDDDDESDMSCSSDGCDCAVLYQEDQVVPDMNRQIANDHSDCRLYESRDGQVLVREDHRSDRQLYDEDINVNYNYLLSQRDDLRMRILRLQIYLNDLKRATDGMVPQVNE